MDLDAIMTRRVVTVEMDDSLRVINSIFTQAKFHHLLVVENRRLMGIISDRDVLKAMSPFIDTLAEQIRDTATLDRRAHQIMSRELVSASKETDIAEAVQLMLRERVSCLPVLSDDGRVEGIVTWKDLLTAYVDTADVLCPACRLRVDVRQRDNKA
jgi:acetoin utilization protein AcuB